MHRFSRVEARTDLLGVILDPIFLSHSLLSNLLPESPMEVMCNNVLCME